MAGPTSPGTEGPTFAPPQLPAGWIAQWDGASRKYYYVQLATGVSQWEVPTQAAQAGSTPGHHVDHPYGTPPQPELITHPDGSQTVKHADGTMEPIMANGPNGDRGLGDMAMNALLGGKNSGHGGGLGGSGGKSSAGKLIGQLASNLLSPSNKSPPPQNYHGGQSTSYSSQGGLAGVVFGGVALMFGGKQSHGSGQNFGYSNAGTGGSYSGEAPTYNPSGSGHSSSTHTPFASQSNQHHGSHSQSHQGQGHQSYQPPPPQAQSPHSQSNYGQSYGGQHEGSGGYSHQPPSYGGPPSGGHNPPYGQSNQGPAGGYHQSASGGFNQGPPGGYNHGPSSSFSQGPPGGYNPPYGGGPGGHQQYSGHNQEPFQGGPY